MSEKIFDSRTLSTEERGRIEAFEADIQKAKDRILDSVSEDIANLGALIKESLATGDLSEFQGFLAKQEMHFAGSKLEYLRDLIIVQRFDLKEFEPEARLRLRQRTLLAEDPAMMTPDYKAAVEKDGIPHCRDCRWFVTGPTDMGALDDKSCVELGTKGADQACIGFTFKEDQKNPCT